MPGLLALDFDGVVSDSAPEAFAVALMTYSEFFPDSRLSTDPYSIDRTPDLAVISDDPLYRAFVELMPLGNRAEDFGIVLQSLEVGQQIDDQEAYDQFREGIDPEWMRRFHARFYEVRTELSTRDTAGWSLLMAPYPAFIGMLRRRRNDTILAIATAKDRRSVGLLLRDYGIDDLFPTGRLLDKETGVHKDSHLQALHDRFSVPFSEMVFIDDKLNHLEVVSALGVRCGLAAWGYNGEREAELARTRGFPVFELDSVESELFDL